MIKKVIFLVFLILAGCALTIGTQNSVEIKRGAGNVGSPSIEVNEGDSLNAVPE